MALEESVGHLVWGLAILLAGGTFGLALVDELEETREASDDRRRADLARIASEAEVVEAEVEPIGDTVRLQVVNAGETNLDPSKASVLFSGTAMSITTWEVDGVSESPLWTPGSHANFTIPSEWSPYRVVFTDEWGHTFTWINPEPSYLVQIVLTPDPTTAQATKTRQFTATGYDQYGGVYPVAPSWSTTVAGASVASSGLFTAGTSLVCGTVTATQSGVSDTADICVERLQVKIDWIKTFKSNTEQYTFRKGDNVKTQMRVVAVLDNVPLGNNVATVTMVTKDPSGVVKDTSTDKNDGSGIAETQYKLPNNGPTGDWTVEVTDVTGTYLEYVPASNTETVQGYTVTN